MKSIFAYKIEKIIYFSMQMIYLIIMTYTLAQVYNYVMQFNIYESIQSYDRQHHTFKDVIKCDNKFDFCCWKCRL